MGTCGGTLGRGAKALPRIQAQVGHGALARSLSGGVSLLFPASQSLPAPPHSVGFPLFQRGSNPHELSHSSKKV